MKISEARICRDCSNLVTADLKCPLCEKLTADHPDQKVTEGYCQICTDKFPSEKLSVVSWNEDAYAQIEEGDLFLICDHCRALAEVERR